jgi:hypothetical protein
MCHHHEADWTVSRTVDEDETEADEGRPPAFEDDRDVEVEVVTDGGDAADE